MLVGLLFEICIVDASIFMTDPCWVGCGCVIFVFLRVFLHALSLDCGVGCVCCLDVVETSYEGHMVDALASRADEGRWSLR